MYCDDTAQFSVVDIPPPPSPLPPGQVELLKVVRTSSEVEDEAPFHVSQTLPLGTESEITQMKLYGTGNNSYVYIGTESGIYRVPGPNCGMEQDCCGCISSRNPYCAYDFQSEKCVAISDENRGSPYLIQDVIGGNSQLCATLPEAVVTPATGESTRGGDDTATVKPPSACGEKTTVTTEVPMATRPGAVDTTLKISTPESEFVSVSQCPRTL